MSSAVAAGGEHVQGCHILAAKALGRNGDAQSVPRHQAQVENGGCVVPRILPNQGVPHHAEAEQAPGISPGHTLVHRVLQRAADDVDLLPQLKKDHGHASILADGQSLPGRKGKIFFNVGKNGAAHGGFLGQGGRTQGGAQVGGEAGVCLNAEGGHSGRDFPAMDVLHISAPARRQCRPLEFCSSSPGGARR